MADNTASLVVALSAQLTKFEKDMRQAGIMADKAVGEIEGKFSKMSPQVSASFFGNLLSSLAAKGLDAAVKAISDFADGFFALKKAADLAEISLARVYGISAALGKDATANAAAIEKLATMLDQMRRGQETTFGELKAANPAFFQNMGKDTFDLAENMARVAEMVKQAGSEVEKLEIAQQAGFAREFVKELEKGGAHFRQMTADNQELGRAIAIAAAQAEVMSKAFAEAARNAFGLKDAMGDFWKDSAMIIGGLVSGLEKMKGLAANTWGAGGGSTLDPVITDLKKMTDGWKAAGDAAAKTYDTQQKITGGGTKTADPTKALAHPALKAAAGGTERESFLDRENRQTEQKIDLLNQEIATVGQSVAVQEAAKEESKLLSAAKRDEITITDDLREAIKAQAETYGLLVEQAAEARKKMADIKSSITEIGSSVSNAFADAILEGKKLNEVMSSLLKNIARMAINKTFSKVFDLIGNSVTASFGKAAEGTSFAPGGMMLVGEKGPELVNLPRGSQVIPNDVLKNSGSLGGSIVYSPAIDARGASVEAVARLAQVLEADRATFATRTIATIQQARRGRIAGL